MKIAVLKETAAGETRCAAIPETVKKYIALGADVAVERGAGEEASIADAEFEAAGAKVGRRAELLKGAAIIVAVDGPDPSTLKGAEKGALLVGALDPLGRRQSVDGYAAAGLEALAMEWMPRITRAQSMDILSSQSNLAGYKAVVDAAAAYGRAFPMMMTAAGTGRPGKALVMGVEGTVAGERVVKHGVTIIGAVNLARSLAADSSALFGRNLYNFLSAFWDKEQGKPVLPDDDEIVKGIRLTHDGKVVNTRLTAA